MMKPVILCLLLVLVLVSCNSTTENDLAVKEPFVYDVYKPSEMALLMNQMFEMNDRVKMELIEGEIPDEFPEEFLNIYTAELTKTKPRTEIFEAYSKVFIDNEMAVFDENNEVPLVEKYNNAINTCLACHKTECVGPIPKIRKLLIN